MSSRTAERSEQSTASSEVTLQQLTRRFDGTTAVDGLTLRIEDREFFTLLGPSGCGKSTTLRMVAGFERPDAGTIHIGADDVTGRPAHERPTNYVFQQYALFPHLSVEDNVAFGLKRSGVARDEVRRRVAQELERVGLSAEAGRGSSQLSGGQQQRVALARALVNRPRVLLLDEPLAALDLKLRTRMRDELKGLQEEVGITFVFVTHDQEEALAMSDRIAVMNKGRIEQVATPQEIYERPATAFVADFIGVSNLMPGRVATVTGGGVEVELAAGVRVVLPARAGVRPADACHVVVRPERLSLERADGDARAPEAGRHELACLLEHETYLGAGRHLQVRLADGTAVTVLVAAADGAANERLPRPGEPARLSWQPRHMHFVSTDQE